MKSFRNMRPKTKKNDSKEDAIYRNKDPSFDLDQKPSPTDEQNLSPSTDTLLALKDGKRAWFVCFSAFTLQIVILGILHAFGVFFVAILKDFKSTKAAAAWIGSACYGITMALSPLSSVVIKKFGHRICASIGCLICATSMYISSYMTNVNHLYGTFTLLFGIGCCMAYTPCMTIATDYFHKYASQATGIIVAGSSAGTLVYSPLTQALVDAFGWRQTWRYLSFGCLLGFVCALQFKPLQNPNKKSESQRIRESIARAEVNELQLWKNKVYIIWIFGIFCVMFGYYIPYVHLISYAVEIGIRPQLAAVLIMTLGATTLTGRIVWGKILQRQILNRLQMDQLSMVITGTFVMVLPLMRSFAGLLAYVLVVGSLDGCYVVLLPTLTENFTGSDKKYIAWGILNCICSITFTMGPVVAGWIYDATGSYDVSFHIAGIPIILGSLVMFFIPWAQKTAKTTNVLTAARENDTGITLDEQMDENDKFIEITTAITIPKRKPDSQFDSYDNSVLPTDGRDSIVVIDLSTSRVQAFSTSQAGGKNAQLTVDDNLPDTIAKAMCVLQRKSQNLSRQGSYQGINTNSPMTPIYSLQRTQRVLFDDNPSAVVSSQGTMGFHKRSTYPYGIRQVTSDQNQPKPSTLVSGSIPIGSSRSPAIYHESPRTLGFVNSPRNNSPKPDTDVSSTYQRFHQITSSSGLPPIAEMPQNRPAARAQNRPTTSGTSSNTSLRRNVSPVETHAMFQQMATFEDSTSNVELNNNNIEGDKK